MNIFLDDIWAYNVQEIEEASMEFKIKWVMPKDKSKLFWEITCPDDPEFKEYASKLDFKIPSRADYNRIYCEGSVIINEDNVATFYNPAFYDPNKEE